MADSLEGSEAGGLEQSTSTVDLFSAEHGNQMPSPGGLDQSLSEPSTPLPPSDIAPTLPDLAASPLSSRDRAVANASSPPSFDLPDDHGDHEVTQRLKGVSPDSALGFDELAARPAKKARRKPPLWMLAALVVVALGAGAFLARDQITGLLPFGGDDEQHASDLLEPAEDTLFPGQGNPEQEGASLSAFGEEADLGQPAANDLDQASADAGRSEPVAAADEEGPVEPEGPAAPDSSGSWGGTANDDRSDQPAAAAAVEAPVSRVTDVAWDHDASGTLITITGNGTFPSSSYGVLALESPPRLLIRLNRIVDSYPTHELAVSTAEVSGVRIGYHPSNQPPQLFVVLDLRDDLVSLVSAEPDGRQLRVRVAR